MADIELLFRLKADGQQSVDEVRRVKKSYDDELNHIQGSFKETALSIGRSLGLSNKEMASYVAGWKLAGGAILGAGAVAVSVGGTLFAMAKQAADAGSRFNDLSIKTGLSVETLSGLSVQLTQSGTSVDVFANNVFLMQRNLEKAATGGKEMRAAFANLGVEDANAALSDTEGTVRTLFASLAKIPDVAQRNAEGARIFGKAYKELAVFVDDTNGNIDEAIEKARELGTQMSTQSAQAADRFGDALDTVTMQLQATSNTMALQFLPTMSDALDDLSAYLSENQDAWKAWGDSIASHMQTVLTIIRAINEADEKTKNDPLWALKYGGAFLESFDRMTDEAARKAAYDADHPWTPIPLQRDAEGGARSRGGDSKADQERGARLKEETKDIEREYRAQSEIIDRELEQQLTSLATATQAIITNEENRYTAQVAVLNKQLALAKKESEHEAIRGDLRQAQIEKDRNIQKARDTRDAKEAAAAAAHADALLRLEETKDAAQIELIRRNAELRVTTYEDAANKIADIETKAFNRRFENLRDQQDKLYALAGVELDETGAIVKGAENVHKINLQDLQKILDALAQLLAEQEARQAKHDADRDDGRKKDVQSAREWARQIRELEYSTLEVALDVGQMKIDAMRRNYESRQAIAKAQADHDRQQEDLRHKRALQDIADEEAKTLALATNAAQRLEIQRHYNEQRALEDERHRERQKGINGQEKTESGEGSIFDGLKREMSDLPTLTEAISSSMVRMWDSVTDAVGETVRQYVLFGEISGKAIRKAVAEALAATAVEMAVLSLKHLGLGFAALTPWGAALYGPAPMQFKAAGFFAAAALAAGAAGRMVAGDAFSKQAGGGSSGSGARDGDGGDQGAGARYRDFTYNSSAQPSSAVAGDGSNNFWRRSVEEARRAMEMQAALHRVAGAVERFSAKFDSISPDDLIVRNHHSVGNAVLEETRSNHGFNMELLRNTGQGR